MRTLFAYSAWSKCASVAWRRACSADSKTDAIAIVHEPVELMFPVDWGYPGLEPSGPKIRKVQAWENRFFDIEKKKVKRRPWKGAVP